MKIRTKDLKERMVFAGSKSPNVHNEIVRIYKGDINGKTKTLVETEQYGATLENQNHNKRVIMIATEITRVLNNRMAHIVLAR